MTDLRLPAWLGGHTVALVATYGLRSAVLVCGEEIIVPTRLLEVVEPVAVPPGVDGTAIGTRVAAERVARPQADEGV